MCKFKRGQWISATALTAILLLSGCSKEETNQVSNTDPVKVDTVIVTPETFVQTRELPGRIEPVRVAEVRARVAGIVLKRHFEEGANVDAGQVLFQIDPAPFQAALSRAQGELEKAEAAIFEAAARVKRYKSLVEIGGVSRQEFDAAQSALKSGQAARASARADVQTAKLNLAYATVKAPISGRIGSALVTEGALVGQDEATPMATIQQLDPIYADFKQPVADMLRMRANLSKEHPQEAAKAPISITIDGTDQKREGQLLFSDITVERSTGQVSLRGQFSNADGLLLPGMYVRVHIQDSVNPQAVLVPQRAVQRSGDGTGQVLVVGQDDIVNVQNVKTGAMQGSRWHILEGLRAGDQVIVGGVAKPGDKVSLADPSSDSKTAASVSSVIQ